MRKCAKTIISLLLLCAMLLATCSVTLAEDSAAPVKLIDYTSFTHKQAGSVTLSVADYKTLSDTMELSLSYSVAAALTDLDISKGFIRIDKVLSDRFVPNALESEPFDVSTLSQAAAGTVLETKATVNLQENMKGTYLIYSGFYDSADQVVEGVLDGWYTRNNEALLGTLVVDEQHGKQVLYFYPVEESTAGNPAETSHIVYAFKSTTKPVLDGDISEWDEKIFGFAAPLSAADPGNFSTTVALSWDDEYLYFIEDRVDDSLFFDDTASRDFFQADNIRIYLSKSDTYMNRNGFDDTDYVICINPNLNGGAPLINNDAYGGANLQYKPSDIKAVYREKADKKGFTAEIAIPFSALQITPQKDMEFGIQIIVDDSDQSGVRAGSYNYLAQVIGAYWESPAGMAKLVLNDGSSDTSLVLQSEADKTSYDTGDYVNVTTNVSYSVPQNGTGSVVFDYGDESFEYTVPMNMKRYSKIFMSVPAIKSGNVDMYTVMRPEDGTASESNRTNFGILKKLELQPTDPSMARIVSKGDTILPSLKQAKYTNEIIEQDGAFLLTYQDGKEDITYRYTPTSGASSDITVFINGEEFYTPSSQSGIRFVTDEGVKIAGELEATVLRAEKTDKGVEATFAYTLPESSFSAQATYIVSISGKTLVLDMSSDVPAVGYAGGLVDFGDLIDEIAYMPDYINLRLGGNMFLSSYVDWRYGNHTAMSREGVTYNTLTDGSYNAFREKYMITLSSDVLEVFPNFNNGISPYREELTEKIMVDNWGTPGFYMTSFSEMENYVKTLKDYGLDDVIFMRHYWQRDGYDMTIPDVMPAHAPYGGDEGLIPVTKLMESYGWRFGLHTNYTDYSPVYKDYNPAHAIVNSTGNIRGGGTFGGILNYLLKPSFYQYYINIFEPEIHNRYSTSLSFVDVYGARTPQRDVDYDAEIEGAGMERYVFEQTEQAINRLREIHDGPFFSEGGSDHARYAGIIDGVEAQGSPLYMLPDFDLTKVFPLSFNHGMGYYNREVRNGTDGLYVQDRFDWYRARQLAYGHQTYISDQLPGTNISEVCKEYYMMLPIQKQFAKSQVETIYYLRGDERLTLSDALREKYFDSGENDRIEITYANGTKIVVNCQEDTMFVNGHELPQNGFYVENPNTGFLALGANKFNGKWGDMSVSDDEVFFSTRNNPFYINLLDIKPTLESAAMTTQSDGNSNGTVELTFNWHFGETAPSTANIILMHITTEGVPGIAISGDVEVPADMKNFVGDYEFKRSLALPDNLIYDQWYNVCVTLYNSPQNERFRINGKQLPGAANLVYSGRMKFIKDGEQTKVVTEPYVVDKGENVPGEMVDFGNVIANNQFTAKKDRGGWNLTVQPRDAELDLVLKDANIEQIVALNEDGKSIGEVSFTKDETGTHITFNNKEAKSYRIQGEIVWK